MSPRNSLNLSISLFRPLTLFQGLYYVITGVWPLIDIDSFQVVTGPKRDLWLVRTVGILITVIGAVLLLAGKRKQPTQEVALLAVGSAASLTAVDVFYVARGTIAPVYLLDAVAEVALLAGWGLLAQQRNESTSNR